MKQVKDSKINPNDFIITRKRKLYKFAVFQSLDNCYDDNNLFNLKNTIDQSKPLIVEVGAGSALFLTEIAKNNTDKQFLAIDRKSDRLCYGAQKAQEYGINNIFYLWTNAQTINQILEDNSVNDLWITFPDPWPQESNIKHRLTNQKNLANYRRILKPNGNLNFKTDNLSLFEWSVEQLISSGWTIIVRVNNLHDSENINNPLIDKNAFIMTTYEDRYHKEGYPINYLRATQ